MQGSAEKGLAQRFMWIFPKPVFEGFSSSEPVDKQFLEKRVIYFTPPCPPVAVCKVQVHISMCICMCGFEG